MVDKIRVKEETIVVRQPKKIEIVIVVGSNKKLKLTFEQNNTKIPRRLEVEIAIDAINLATQIAATDKQFIVMRVTLKMA
jgi:hypothetical protein